MKLIRQSHKIISIPENILQTIESIGRTCYKSEDKITETSAEGFVNKLINNKHYAMIEFGEVENDISCIHQIVKRSPSNTN